MSPLSPERIVQLATVCVCGHEYRHHHDDGPCIAGYVAGDGRDRASVCPCVLFIATTAAVLAPSAATLPRRTAPGPRAERPAPSTEGSSDRAGTASPAPSASTPTVCKVKGCKDPATVVVERNGKAYCRPHGLAEALKRPRCQVRPLENQLAEAWRAA